MSSLKNLAWSALDKLTLLGCRLNRPWLTALAWRIALVRLPSIRKPVANRGRVIVLNKIGGTDDLIIAHQEDAPEFDFLFLRRGQLRVVFKYFLGERVRNYDYVSADPAIENSKLAYRRYLTEVLRRLHRIMPFQAALSFNVSYEAEREFAAAMTEVGIPHIVFHKESVKTEAQSKVYIAVYRDKVGPYLGSHIAVYNVEERQTMLAAGIARPEQISVIGCPRVDLSHKLRGKVSTAPAPPTVVYFTIDERASLPYADKLWVPYGQDWYQGPPLLWRELASQTSTCLLEFARENPGIRVLLKAKQGNVEYSRSVLGGELPPNVSFIGGGIGHHLLSQADVVVGFNSASLLESIAAGVPVAVPMFAIEPIAHLERFVYQLQNVAVRAATRQELKSALLQLLERRSRATQLSEAAKRALDRYMGNSDGAASQRLRAYLRNNIPAANSLPLRSRQHGPVQP